MADDGGDDDEAYTRKYAAARYALAGVYVLMAFLSLALLVTSPRAAAPPAGAPAKRGGWTWQRMFHVFVLLGLVGRAVFMFLQPSVEQNVLDMPNCVNVFISIMPSLLFFSGYIVLACFWAEMYYLSQPLTKSTDGREGRRLLHIYIGVNIAMYVVYFILMAVDLPNCFADEPPNDDPDYPVFSTVLQLIASSFNAAIYLILAVVFCFFAVRFYQTLVTIRTSSILSRTTRLDVLRKLIAVASILSAMFVTRCSILIKNVVNDTTSELWWFDPLYYFVLEVIPLLTIFFIFRASANGSTPPANGSLSVSAGSDVAPSSPVASRAHRTTADEKAPLLVKTATYNARGRANSGASIDH
eukprot:Unigene343_Nuclearia_a/m.1191 Unigene343_Nuclearia_a/g.1191  ORF Unigene343_Nuclearia_a/g.1191 Unigene343_Nuclearia_a/m.1191 type:complete len:356 (+) Unigene343_Nuclearia_a:42-1109(+)